MRKGMLTSDDGPVVCSEKTLRALVAIRRDALLPKLFGEVTIARSVWVAMEALLTEPRSWLRIADDCPDQALPDRVISATPSEAATLRLALALPASLVLLENPIKEKAKLSFIKAEGTLSLLVQAYRLGHLSAVQPMVKALKSLGHGDVLPEEHMLASLWKALDQMES